MADIRKTRMLEPAPPAAGKPPAATPPAAGGKAPPAPSSPAGGKAPASATPGAAAGAARAFPPAPAKPAPKAPFVAGPKPDGVVVAGPAGSELLTHPFADYEGESIARLYIVLKRTYDLREGQPAAPSRAPVPIFFRDVFASGTNPMDSWVLHEGDLWPPKVATDVIVHARAYAPGGVPVSELTVTVEVIGHGRKDVLVIGDRAAILPDPDQSLTTREVRFTAPRTFKQMPLGWDRAYGGWDRLGKEPLPYMKNPTGLGYVDAIADRPTGYIVQLPNLEDPKDRLKPNRFEVSPPDWSKWLVPCSLGWYPRYWMPRAELIGNPDPGLTMEELFPGGVPEGVKIEWKPTDPRYRNGAPSGLAVGPLTGNETIVLTNLHRTNPRYTVKLSGDRPVVSWDPGDGPRWAKPVLGTVAIDLEAERLYQTWVAQCDIDGVHVPRYLPKIRIKVA